VSDRINWRLLADAFYTRLCYASENGSSEELAMHNVLRLITNKVSAQIADDTLSRLRDEIQPAISQAMIDAQDRFRTRTEDYFKTQRANLNNTLENENYQMRKTLRNVLLQAFSPEELNCMASRAQQDATVETTNQENA
jgi:hypothetical protein